MEATVPAILNQLADEGYPLTDQRRELVALVMEQTRRFTADDLLGGLRERGHNIGRATIFRTLDLLVRLGHVGRVRDGGRGGYAVCNPGHHHHLVCSSCGRVLHIAGCPVASYLSDLESQTGFSVAHHSLEIAGLCQACRESEAGAPHGP